MKRAILGMLPGAFIGLAAGAAYNVTGNGWIWLLVFASGMTLYSIALLVMRVGEQ